MSNLVIIRHGQSQWNLENKFTGWVDVELAPKGIEEAKAAGVKLKQHQLVFDQAFTSDLKRAQNTLQLALHEAGQQNLAVIKDKALNERMYGDLQGLDKDETRQKYGDEQVKIWRRSYDIKPPNGESLKDTADRVIPYFEKNIAPLLKQGRNIIVVAHGNSLRALIMYLEKLSPDEILQVEIPTGTPKLYVLDAQLNIIKAEYL